jgi:16S rRNA G527 N7-methylase RsmG
LRDAGGTADLVERYLAELDRWNAKFGFVKATADELVVKHVLDSIAGASVVAGLSSSRGGDVAGRRRAPWRGSEPWAGVEAPA